MNTHKHTQAQGYTHTHNSHARTGWKVYEYVHTNTHKHKDTQTNAHKNKGEKSRTQALLCVIVMLNVSSIMLQQLISESSARNTSPTARMDKRSAAETRRDSEISENYRSDFRSSFVLCLFLKPFCSCRKLKIMILRSFWVSVCFAPPFQTGSISWPGSEMTRLSGF